MEAHRRTFFTERGIAVPSGTPASDRQRALVNRLAPDATLLDLEGTQRRLSEWSGTRRLLVAFSSW